MRYLYFGRRGLSTFKLPHTDVRPPEPVTVEAAHPVSLHFDYDKMRDIVLALHGEAPVPEELAAGDRAVGERAAPVVRLSDIARILGYALRVLEKKRSKHDWYSGEGQVFGGPKGYFLGVKYRLAPQSNLIEAFEVVAGKTAPAIRIDVRRAETPYSPANVEIELARPAAVELDYPLYPASHVLAEGLYTTRVAVYIPEVVEELASRIADAGPEPPRLETLQRFFPPDARASLRVAPATPLVKVIGGPVLDTGDASVYEYSQVWPGEYTLYYMTNPALELEVTEEGISVRGGDAELEPLLLEAETLYNAIRDLPGPRTIWPPDKGHRVSMLPDLWSSTVLVLEERGLYKLEARVEPIDSRSGTVAVSTSLSAPLLLEGSVGYGLKLSTSVRGSGAMKPTKRWNDLVATVYENLGLTRYI